MRAARATPGWRWEGRQPEVHPSHPSRRRAAMECHGRGGEGWARSRMGATTATATTAATPTAGPAAGASSIATTTAACAGAAAAALAAATATTAARGDGSLDSDLVQFTADNAATACGGDSSKVDACSDLDGRDRQSPLHEVLRARPRIAGWRHVSSWQWPGPGTWSRHTTIGPGRGEGLKG